MITCTVEAVPTYNAQKIRLADRYKVSSDDFPTVTITSDDSPVLDYCRALLAVGVPEDTSLQSMYGGTRSMFVKSIGEGAKWFVRDTPKVGPIFELFERREKERSRIQAYVKKTRSKVE